MLTFRHAGDLGDIIFSLPVVKWMCEQHQMLAMFYIEAATYTRSMLTRDKWFGIDRILKAQPYIHDVDDFRPQRVTTNLNDFRVRMEKSLRFRQHFERSLTDWFLDAHQVPADAAVEPWLQVQPNFVAPVVINRTGPGRRSMHVYHNHEFPWRRVVDKYGDIAVFIGSPLEHEVFCACFGHVAYCPTADLYEAARVIAGCGLFIGNQSCPHAIAEGMKKNIVLEVWPNGPNCLFYRPGVTHGYHDAHRIDLPDIKFGAEPPLKSSHEENRQVSQQVHGDSVPEVPPVHLPAEQPAGGNLNP